MDQELADSAAAYVSVICFVCTRQMAALFCTNWHHSKVWRHIENLESHL